MAWILASASPYRKAQLLAFGLSFETVKPRVDEEALKKVGPADLAQLTRFLAEKKALSLRDAYPNEFLIGSDQIVECEGERLDKPGNFENAVQQLARLQGKSHRLITSLTVSLPKRDLTATDVTEIRLRPLNTMEIEAYVAEDKPFDCAGSYKIERAGMYLIEAIHSADPSAIQGLPLLLFSQMIRELKIPLSQIWSRPHESN